MRKFKHVKNIGNMEMNYIIILDFCVGCVNVIKLTEEEKKKSYQYDDFEDFLCTLEEKYGFKVDNCQWMGVETLETYYYENGALSDNSPFV